MGGPAMIEGGGLGAFAPEEVGPVDGAGAERRDRRASPTDEAAAVAAAKRFLSLLPGPRRDRVVLRRPDAAARPPSRPTRKRVHDVARPARHARRRRTRCWSCAARFGRTVITALARDRGAARRRDRERPATPGRRASTPTAADKAARFMQLCDAFGLPVVSLVDTPGFMVGPESEQTAAVRHSSRMFLTAATLSVPFLCVDRAARVRPRRAGDGRRLAARAGDHGGVAERRVRRDGRRGRGAARRCAASWRRSPTRRSASSA